MNRLTRPAQLPAERDRLTGCWIPNGAYYRHVDMLQGSGVIVGSVDAYTRFEERTTRDGALWWVSEEMCDLVEVAMESVPDETLLEESLLPDLRALCWFARPLILTDAATGTKSLSVDAVLWGPASLVDAPFLPPGPHDALGWSSYQWMDEIGLVPLGRSDWLLGTSITQVLEPGPTGRAEYGVSSIEDRRLAAALWLLASQPGLTTHDIRPPFDRAEMRRRQRARLSLPTVRVVKLRHTSHTSTGTGTGSKVSVRFPVSGHWRQQAYGPGRAYRRPKWIAPHMKGPEDAPLHIRPTVKVLG